MAETIFALASGGERAGLAVIRVSGPAAGPTIDALTGRAPGPARVAELRAVRDPRSGEVIDRGLVLWFPAPRSFTGEDTAEFQIHGGRANIARVLGCLGAIDGLRPAEAGEFSRRAFENGKLDLTAIEGIADLVAAETEAQRRQAFRQMEGDLGRLYEGWRGRLLRAMAHIESLIDFSDEDLPEGLGDMVGGEIRLLKDEIEGHLQDGGWGQRLRDGVSVAIIGAPNVGKSTLLNALAKRDAAIVSAKAGTTRDVVEVHMDLGGFPVVLADTAGLRQVEEEVEAEGVRRARARAEGADIRLAVLDGTCWPEVDRETGVLIDASTLVVVNKIDQVVGRGWKHGGAWGDGWIGVSAVTGEGVPALLGELTKRVGERCTGSGEVALTRLRHRSALEDARKGLADTLEDGDIEVRAEGLRRSVTALGRITGRVGVEEMLDVVFQEFCIGK